MSLSAKEENVDDETEMVQNPSDYYGLSNVNSSFSDAENDAFSDEDI